MSELVKQGSQYTDDVRRDAATQYAIKGNLSVISRETNIPRTTLIDWKNSDWWDAIIDEVRHQKADEHIAKYSELVDAAQKVALAKLPEATAAQASIIAATATDKARLLLNQPTSISGKAGDSMEAMRKKFEAIEDQYQAQKKILDGTVIGSQDSTKGPIE